MEYLKRFSEHSGYTEYAVSPNLITPNVSYCEDDNEVHYNPNDNGKYVIFNFKRNSTDENLLRICDDEYYENIGYDDELDEPIYKRFKSDYYINGIKMPDDYVFLPNSEQWNGGENININERSELNSIVGNQLLFQIKYSTPYKTYNSNNCLHGLQHIGDKAYYDAETQEKIIPVDNVIIGSGITSICTAALYHSEESRKYIFTNPNGCEILAGSNLPPFGNCYKLDNGNYALFVPSGSEGNYQNFIDLGYCDEIIPYNTIEEALSY